MKLEEIAKFMAFHNINREDVLDAKGMRTSEYKARMKIEGKKLAINVTACEAGGHTIRTSNGHCAVCNPQGLHYKQLYHEPGYVYALGSPSTLYLKIGTSKNVAERVAALNREGYAGCHDWEFLLKVHVSNAGRVENNIHSSLDRWRVSAKYFRYQEGTEATEAFECDLETALESITRLLGEEDAKKIEYSTMARRKKYIKST
jgi:hypothetical protein